MIETDDEFESRAEREGYASSGYQDLDIREDAEERKAFLFQRNFIKLPTNDGE